MTDILWFWGPAVAYMVLIFGLSASSNLPALPGRFSDKVAHFLEYAVLGVLLVRAAGRRAWTTPRLGVVVAAVMLAVLYALSDEGHQSFVPNRDPDWRDALADSAGACTSAACIYARGAIDRKRRKHHGLRVLAGGPRGRRRGRHD